MRGVGEVNGVFKVCVRQIKNIMSRLGAFKLRVRKWMITAVYWMNCEKTSRKEGNSFNKRIYQWMIELSIILLVPLDL